MRIDRLLIALALAWTGTPILALAETTTPLTLGRALQMASQYDAELASAQALRNAQAEESLQERTQLRPRVHAEAAGSYNYYDSKFAYGAADDDFQAWSARLNARQPLYRFDWSATKRRADSLLGLADEDLADAQVQFIARVAQRYLDTLLAEDALEQAKSEFAAFSESLEDTQKRFDVGLVPGTDLKDATARKDIAEAGLIAARAAVADRRDALIEVTGYDGSALPKLVETPRFAPLDPPDLDSWIELARKESSASNRAQLELELAQTRVRSARAIAMPEVDLVAQAGHTDSLDYILGQEQSDSSVALQLTVPIYSGGLASSQVREAENRLLEAEAELLRVQRQLDRDIRARYRAIGTALAEEKAFSVALVSAIAAERSTRAGYDAGSRTITDVLDARSRLVEARQRRNEARYQLLIRLLQLFATAGTLTVEQVSAIDVLFDHSGHSDPDPTLAIAAP